MKTKRNKDNIGTFVISLDFELFWGVRDKRTLDNYGPEIQKVHEILPEMLEVFREYGVKVTFATVGLLFSKNKSEMLSFIPKRKPIYADRNLSPYTDNLQLVKETPKEDPYHFALDLIEVIKNDYPEHEIGSHTFSHFYCQEEGQNIKDFEADLQAAIAIASDKGIEIASLVFPRNQYNKEYLQICSKYGIKTYRGNEKPWYYAPESESNTTLKKRIFRTLDCYVNLSGHNTPDPSELKENELINVPSSRFLRPYNPKGGLILETLKLKRIKRSMTYAAKKGLLYHLWWHPHNFAGNSNINFSTLRAILKHYHNLNQRYGFESSTMGEVGQLVK